MEMKCSAWYLRVSWYVINTFICIVASNLTVSRVSTPKCHLCLATSALLKLNKHKVYFPALLHQLNLFLNLCFHYLPKGPHQIGLSVSVSLPRWLFISMSKSEWVCSSSVDTQQWKTGRWSQVRVQSCFSPGLQVPVLSKLHNGRKSSTKDILSPWVNVNEIYMHFSSLLYWHSFQSNKIYPMAL